MFYKAARFGSDWNGARRKEPRNEFHWRTFPRQIFPIQVAFDKNSKYRLDTNLPSINDDPSDELGEVDDILNGDNDGKVQNICMWTR